MIDEVYHDLETAVRSAESKFPEYRSSHEGYAIIAEELDELWDEIKEKSPDSCKLYNESLHVAVTALRFCNMVRSDR